MKKLRLAVFNTQPPLYLGGVERRILETAKKLDEAGVGAIVMRRREDSQPQFLDKIRCDRWEVVVPELVFVP